jgi:phosphoribosyl-ATP pyrophosphohydrolase/phosphoribosyl-AMP cyclohydrolase
MTKEEILEAVKFDDKGLVCCVIQDYHAKKVRMVAYMNKEALEKTLETKQMTYWSRSRGELWVKGETSGYYQYMKGLSIYCDGNAFLLQVEQVGGISCHIGHATCFY